MYVKWGPLFQEGMTCECLACFEFVSPSKNHNFYLFLFFPATHPLCLLLNNNIIYILHTTYKALYQFFSTMPFQIF